MILPIHIKETFILLHAFSSSLLNLAIPGAGLAILGRWHLALLTQVFLIVSILLLSWSRLVFEPLMIKIFLGVIGAIYFVSTTPCFIVKQPAPIKHLRQWLLVSGFIMISLSGLAAGYIYKHQWLGFHIYFVPSMSMHPTLKPGQFILIDTWAYHDKTPKLKDVVVFEHGIEKKHLVKRINHWPNGETTKNKLWYVMGDNLDASQDSRYFGGVTTKQLVGKVKLILIAFDKQQQLTTDVLLIPVR